MIFGGFSLTALLLTLLAGVGAGFVGYAVGASSLVSYPALLALGIPPVIANASNTLGVIGTGIGGCLGARKELAKQKRRTIEYFIIGAIGGIAGALLLIGLPAAAFEYVVPPLILGSAVMIAVNPRGRREAKEAARAAQAQLAQVEKASQTSQASRVEQIAQVETVRGEREKQSSSADTASATTKTYRNRDKDPFWLRIGTWFVAIYSGYFGAGAGTFAIAMLDAAEIGPFHEMNALKTVVGTGANITASIVFIFSGAIDWPAALLLGVGCFIGGYIAPPITRHIPAKIMRGATVLAGVILAANLGIKTYF